MTKLLLLSTCLCLSACADWISISEADLEGVYIANYRGQTGTLSIMADHTYTHVVELKDGHRHETKETWEVSHMYGKTIIEFFNFRAVPSFNDGVQHGWIIKPQKTLLGYIQLCFNLDLGYCYVKQRP